MWNTNPRKVVSSGTTSNNVVAVKDAFLSPRGEWDKTGLPMIKRVGEYGINIASYAHASLWNGKPLNETAAGYGH